jgi:hypothetical protein
MCRAALPPESSCAWCWGFGTVEFDVCFDSHFDRIDVVNQLDRSKAKEKKKKKKNVMT